MKKALIFGCLLVFLSGCSGQNNEINSDNHTTENNIIKMETEPREQVSLEGLSNELIGWGMKKNQNAAPDIPSNVKTMLKKYNSFYMGNENSNNIYLTFDQGYENGFTPKILDILKANNVKATFFVTGDYAEREEELIKRMAKEGHIVGNHSLSHPSFPLISEDEIENEMIKLDEMIKNITGQKVVYARPPKGEYSEKVLAKLSNMGYTTVFWSFAYFDWDVTIQKGGDYAFSQIMPYLHNGAIILLHSVSSDNADALDRVIKEAKANGYNFASLDTISAD